MTDDMVKELSCIEIEQQNKPTLLYKAYNNARTAVVVIDMVNGFCKKGALASPNVGRLITPIGALLDYLPQAKKFFIIDYHSPEALEFKVFPPHCHTAEESAVVSELESYVETLVKKNSTNGIFAFLAKTDTGLFDNFIVVGDCTDICILQFCLSLCAYLNEKGQHANVITLTDCVATFEGNMHSAALFDTVALKLMEQSGVAVFKTLK
ncbi:MAG: cysteine hydrolase [Firmicutes bacterium]|nr:cysteine hydrolase [Bacillota bacterium]